MLSRPSTSIVVPSGLAAVVRPPADDAAASRVVVGSAADALVPVAPNLPTRVLYDDFALPSRGALLLRGAVLKRLAIAAKSLPKPFGLVVLDGWRSLDFQSSLLSYYRELYPSLESGYVSDPDHGAIVPPHTTGAAVDLTLTWRGEPLALGTDYDSFSERAHPAALEELRDGDILARDLRRLLSDALLKQEFAPYPLEWWHWSYGDQWWAAHFNLTESLYAQITLS